MNLLDSLRLAARNYPGGLEAVALRLGKSESTLDKELRRAPQFKMGADDAAEIAAMCMEVGSPHAADYPTRVAEAVGGTLLLLPQGADACSEVTAMRVAELMREFADVISAATSADAKQDFRANRMVEIRREWAELVSSGQRLMQHLEARHEATMAKWQQGGAA